MIEMSVTDFARNLRNVFDRIEHDGTEIILHRNKHRIARIIPGSPHLTAREAMGDLYRTLSDDAAATWLAESRLTHTVKDEGYNPWES